MSFFNRFKSLFNGGEDRKFFQPWFTSPIPTGKVKSLSSRQFHPSELPSFRIDVGNTGESITYKMLPTQVIGRGTRLSPPDTFLGAASTEIAPSTIQGRFELFHKENPHIYSELVSMARAAKRAGHDKYGIETLFAVLRWNQDITTFSKDFKLNNDYRSRYARKIMMEEPELAGFFNIRRRRTV